MKVFHQIYYLNILEKKTEIERKNYLLEKKLSSIVDSICSYHFFSTFRFSADFCNYHIVLSVKNVNF